MSYFGMAIKFVRRTRYMWLLVPLWASLSAASSPPPELMPIFNTWLEAFNASDANALRKFGERWLGDGDTAFTLDLREETGGLEVVRIERKEAGRLVILLRERVSNGQRRITIQPTGDGGKTISMSNVALAMPQSRAIAAMDAFAGRLEKIDKFSGAIAIMQGKTILYRKAFGVADRSIDRKIIPETPFFIASQGKMFTGIAILQLVEQKKVALDDPLGKFLPNYPNKAMAQVTIRQLLTHTGGTGDIGILGPEDAANRAWVRDIADVIKLNGNRDPAFPPGTRPDYSNFGFILLGAVIEKVTGQSYYDYVAAHVLQPAGMNHTKWPTRDALNDIALPYSRSATGAVESATAYLPWRGMSAGGGVSTIDDELRLSTALTSGKLIGLPLLREATRQQTQWYGFGFISSGPREFPHWGHGGGAPGMSAVFAVYPTNDMTMVCLANSDPPVCDRLMLSLHFHLAPPSG